MHVNTFTNQIIGFCVGGLARRDRIREWAGVLSVPSGDYSVVLPSPGGGRGKVEHGGGWV